MDSVHRSAVQKLGQARSHGGNGFLPHSVAACDLPAFQTEGWQEFGKYL
jgi:hypothetical protein